MQCNGSVTSNGDVALTDLISFHSMSDPFKPVRGALHVRHFKEDGQSGLKEKVKCGLLVAILMVVFTNCVTITNSACRRMIWFGSWKVVGFKKQWCQWGSEAFETSISMQF